MLEEGLRSVTFSPSEASQGLLSFVRFELQDGGANEEKRFIGFFSLLCDRLFGTTGGPKENYRHEIGGWLSRQVKWEQPRLPPSSSRSHHHSSSATQTSSIDNDPVVQLLCGMKNLKSKDKLPTLIEAISGDTESRRGVRLQFPFYALPKPTQEFVKMMVQSAMMDGTTIVDDSLRPNAYRLFGGLLRVKPRDQTELRNLNKAPQNSKSQSRPLSLGGAGGSPLMMSSTQHPKTTEKKKKPESPQMMLNMVEYYLIWFIRYPLAAPAPTTPAPQGRPSVLQNGMTPTRPMEHIARSSSRSTPYGEIVYVHLFRSYLNHYLANPEPKKPFLGYAKLGLEHELFLRLVIELWLCNNIEVAPMQKAAGQVLERRKKNGDASADLGLDAAFDLAKIKYEPPPAPAQHCLKSLVVHVMKNPLLRLAVFDCHAVAAAAKDSQAPPLPWCLSPDITILQQSFYNYIVASFRHAAIHVSGSPFYAALDMWLLWLEPWNVETKKKHSSTDLSHGGRVLGHSNQRQETVQVLRMMKPQAKSRYDKRWEPFIAANIHLYLVPLALFLRRARELDFSSKYFSRSLASLQRVFRIYSPEIVASINRVLSEGTSSSLGSLVDTHNKNLGIFSPSLVCSIRLKSLQGDMGNLLEEIDMQHRKTVRERDYLDRMEAYVEGIFTYMGLASSSTGEERQILSMMEKAKLITGLADDFVLSSTTGEPSAYRSRSVGAGDKDMVMKNGVLTERGLDQVLSGQVMCKPTDVAFVGESLYSTPKSFEVSWLVRPCIRLSEHLNTKLGLEARGDPDMEGRTKSSLQINLRFLADYRNLLILSIIFWAWSTFL